MHTTKKYQHKETKQTYLLYGDAKRDKEKVYLYSIDDISGNSDKWEDVKKLETDYILLDEFEED